MKETLREFLLECADELKDRLHEAKYAKVHDLARILSAIDLKARRIDQLGALNEGEDFVSSKIAYELSMIDDLIKLNRNRIPGE